MIEYSLEQLEELTKAIDPKVIKMFMHNAKIMNDASLPIEDRTRAAENVFAINMNHAKANKGAKPMKAIAQEFMDSQKNTPPEMPTAEPPVAPFHEEFGKVHGIDPVKFKSTFDAMSPDQQKITQDFHTQHMANSKIAKSIDNLYTLFEQLKKQL